MFKRMRGERGFTLVELLVVLGILAILVAIVVPNLTGLLGTTEETARKQELDVVQSAIDTYNTQDVAIDNAGTILAKTWTPIDPTNTSISFSKYLRRKTKYYYSWADEGESLTVSKTGG